MNLDKNIMSENMTIIILVILTVSTRARTRYRNVNDIILLVYALCIRHDHFI